MNKNKIAKQAGKLYLLMLFGAVGLVYVPSQILDANQATLTVQNIINQNFLLRIGIIANVICQIAFIFLAIKLFQLFEEVDRFLSLSLLCVVITSVPVAFMLIHYQIDALFIVKQSYLSVNEIESSAQWSMIQFNNGLSFIGIFWGLWLIPFGLLSLKSGYLHKIIGYLLVAGGIAYMLDALVFILVPNLRTFTYVINAIIPTIAELSAIYWLLVKGVNQSKIVQK
jgi:hypothetical protein